MKTSLQEIALYGERCSGTNLFAEILRLNTGAQVTYPLGFKHFPRLYSSEEIRRLLKGRPVLFLIRHPESWVRSMYLNPWHARKEIREKGFADFLRCEWESIWDEEANVFPGNPRYGRAIAEDRDGATGKPFRNLLHMRAEKIRRFQKIEGYADKAIWIRLEDLVLDQESIFRKVAGEFELTHTEKFVPVLSYKGNASWRWQLLQRMGLSRWSSSARREEKKPPIVPDDRAFIWSEINPRQEMAFGYAPGFKVESLQGKEEVSCG